MTEYDIGAAFEAIEDELIASMIRNMDHHRVQEDNEGLQWSMWQAEQLKALEKYKLTNQKKYSKQFKSINGQIGEILYKARRDGNMQQEIQILNAIKNGFIGTNKVTQRAAAEFFRLNDRKLEALIKATTDDTEKAEMAVLRKANDEYRKAIYNAQIYANTGAGTYEKAVDMATKDMLSRGLTCVEYANGARHTLADYADMAIRTASKRAYLQGEGEKRQEWGIATVIVNKRGNPCPKCLPFCGKVLIDDVWSGGEAYINGKQRNKTPSMGVDKNTSNKYPLMSRAIAAGLYHPRCKDSHTTYFPGISTADDIWTKEELENVEKANKQEAKHQYAERQAEKFERLAAYSLDKDSQRKYKRKAEEWAKQSSKLTLEEEGAVIRYISPSSITLNDKLRTGEELTDFEKEWIMNLNKALDKLPEYKGDLNRSLDFPDSELAQEFFDNLKAEEEFPQYISATKAGIYNPDGQVQIYIQDSKTGKDLKGLNDMENEVLYPINTKFRVVNKVKHGDKFYILLEEVE